VVADVLRRDRFPVVLGGDCGLGVALKQVRQSGSTRRS
jgi:arginase family enzyme